MADSSLQPANLAKSLREMDARLKRLELEVSVRPVFLIATVTDTTSTTFGRIAWSSFPRSGSSLTVDVSVTLSGGASSCDLQLRADGTQIGAATVTSSGTVTLTGFLPSTWAFGARKVVEVQAKVPGGTAALAVVGAWHR